MAKWIKASGEVVEVEAARPGKKFTLDELQRYVGGYIERLEIAPRLDMICNEEGKLHGLPVNQVATALARTQVIVGDVLVVERGKW